MTKLTASKFDVLTNELSVRDLTDDEIATLEAKAAAKAEKLAQQLTEAEAKAEAKAAAQAKLAALGLTVEDLQALGL